MPPSIDLSPPSRRPGLPVRTQLVLLVLAGVLPALSGLAWCLVRERDEAREQAAISDDERWRTYFLQVFGRPIPANCQRCPRTAELLRAVPGLGNAVFSILLPGKHIPEHRGPYKGLLRYHLALRVPAPAEGALLHRAQ